MSFNYWKFNRVKFAFVTIIVFMLLLLSYSTWYLFPVINAGKSLHPLGSRLAFLRKNHEKIGMYMYNNPHYYFYTGSYITLLNSPEELRTFLSSKDRVLCVLEEVEFKNMEERLKASMVVLESVVVGRRKFIMASQYPSRPLL